MLGQWPRKISIEEERKKEDENKEEAQPNGWEEENEIFIVFFFIIILRLHWFKCFIFYPISFFVSIWVIFFLYNFTP